MQNANTYDTYIAPPAHTGCKLVALDIENCKSI